jgi:hypothetical protein
MYLLNRKSVKYTLTFITVLAYWLMVMTSISHNGIGTSLFSNPYLLYGMLLGIPLFVILKVAKYKALRLCALLFLLIVWITAFKPLVITIMS